MRVIERTHDPSLSDVRPNDLTYRPQMASVGHVRPYELGGKDLRALLVWEEDRPVRPKQHLHLITDDGDCYEWARFSDDERWTFERRLTDSGPDTVSRQLPGVVEAVVEQRGLLY